MMRFIVIAAATLILTSIAGVLLIPLLTRLKFGQEIREEGPKWHKKKSGTPTMGGFIFILPFVIVSVIYPYISEGADKAGAMFITLSAVCFGAIGFLDDYIKVILKRNLGLTALQKLSLQIIVSVVFVSLITGLKIIDTAVMIPFTGRYINVGYLVLPLDLLVMLATVNSVNLTDGLDGLAATVTAVVAVFFGCAAYKASLSAVLTASAAICGGLLGFLIYNKYPAKVFMGDTGSLFLGGLLASLAVYMKNPFILLVVGFVWRNLFR